jgi:16S rRNA (guanine(527)-N(7))-methyltransferase RsmG
MRERLYRELQKALPDYGIELEDEAMRRLAHYLELLTQWNGKLRLVGSVEADALVRRHVAESLWLSQLLPLHGQTLIDVGSGAGFPGMALQLAWPQLQVTLIDANAKKVSFLKTVARTFGLGRVLQARLEEVEMEGEIVTARALEHMDEAGPGRFRHLVAHGGMAAFWIGEETARNWRAAEAGWQWGPVRTIPGSEHRTITLARRPGEAEG